MPLTLRLDIYTVSANDSVSGESRDFSCLRGLLRIHYGAGHVDDDCHEWTDATWNPVSGCTAIGCGCDHC
jgi:hypothetical protein